MRIREANQKENDTIYTDMPLAFGDEASSGGGDAAVTGWDYIPAEEPVPHAPFSPPPVLEDVPCPVVRLWKDCQQQLWTIARHKVFREQAVRMATFGDSTGQVVPFLHYYPVYQDMTIAQLRSYFTLRRQLRLGKHPEMSTSYLFVYIYETLMQIGVGSPEEGFEILRDLASAYGGDAAVRRYLKQWMRDYVVYYGLQSCVDEAFAGERAQDRDVTILAGCAHASDADLWEVLGTLSSYPLTKTALYRRESEAVRTVSLDAVRRIAPILEGRAHHRFDKICMDLKRRASYYRMFASAVFYDPAPPMEREFTVTARRRFVCEGGLWKYYQDVREGRQKSRILGTILREADRQLRLALHAAPRLVETDIDAVQKDAVAHAVSAYLRAREAASRPRVVIDANRFSAIRHDAAVVQQALLTEDERDDMQGTVLEAPARQDAATSPFSPTERQYLSLLLRGGNAGDFLRRQRILPGVITESINEKSLNLIGDILIDDDGLIEDYLDDIKHLIEE